jgi:histidinol phosphatase-like enzyme
MNDPSRLFAPIPGTIPAPRALFVDRWGTLLELPRLGYARTVSELCFLDGAIDALFRAGRAGWRIYLVGNEDAVARGEMKLDAWRSVEKALAEELVGAGVPLARCYACVDHPQGVRGRQLDSVFLLPNTGAFYHAAHSDGVDLKRSWVIGDSTLELVAGWRSGCKLAAVRTGLGLSDAAYEVDPDLVVGDLAEAVDSLLALQSTLAI